MTAPDLTQFSERALYRLAFDISEELVRRETARLYRRAVSWPAQADRATALVAAEMAAQDCAETNWGAW